MKNPSKISNGVNTKKPTIYLDYAATTPVDPRALKAMLPYFGPSTKQGSRRRRGSYFSEKFGNTMSLHALGQEAKETLEGCRETMAEFLGAKPKEIIFTGSATESNNLALKGVAWANRNKGGHIIISQIEHPCVMESAAWLEQQGFEITRIKVDRYGLVEPRDIEKAIKKETILVSVMHANNEIGAIEPIEEIGKICREKGVLFHTDASQSFGKIPINADKMNIDLLTASSHKMYGPKGAALLYVREPASTAKRGEGIKIEPLLHGGGHEQGLRSSTVNIPAIVGFAAVVNICQKEMKKESKRLTKLRDKLIKEALETIPNSHLNGHPKNRLPNNANFYFDFVEGESIVIQLDLLGVAVSTGSACSSRTLEPSHVLLAIGLKHQQAHGSLRISLGRWTKEKEIDYVLKILPGVIKNLRKISPFHA